MSPGPEDEVTQAERRRILLEGTTLHQHAQSHANDEAGGRFAAVNTATVTGTTPIPSYPAASTSWQIQLPDEPPLSPYENPALDESSAASMLPADATGDPANAPLSGYKPAPTGSSESERAGSSSSTDDGGFDDAA